MIEGIERPAIAALWPTLKGEAVVLDVGASIGADEQHLINLAAMGSAMARVLFDIERPTVGLLNIGVEEIKGLEQVREAGRLLREGQFPAFQLCRLCRRRRYRQGHGRRGGDRRLCRQYRAEDRGRHRPAVRAISQECDEPDLGGASRLSAVAPGVPHAARQDGPAQIQRRRVSRPQRHRHQESWRRRRRGLRFRHRPGL